MTPSLFLGRGVRFKKKIGRATLLQYDDHDNHLPKFWESQPQFLYFYKKTLGRTNMDINNWNTINLWEKSCHYFHGSGNQTECMIMISKKSVSLIIFNYIHFPIHTPEPVSSFKFIFPSNVIEFILRIVIYSIKLCTKLWGKIHNNNVIHIIIIHI